MDFSASGYLHFYNNNNFIANNWAHLNCNYWPGVTPQASALCAPTWHIPQMDGPPDPGNPPAHLTPEHGEHGLPSAGGGGTACNAVAAAKAEGEAVPLTSVPQGFNGQLQDETHCLMRTMRGRGVAVQYTELPRPPAGPDGAPGNRLFEALAQQLTGCSPLRERLFPRVALLRRRVGEHLAARRAAYLEHLLDAVLTNQDHYPPLRFADASGVPNAEAMMLAYIADIDSLVEQRHFGAEVIRACADLEAVAVVVLTEGLWAHTVQPVGVPAQRTLCVYKGANGQYASVLQIARDDGDLPPPTPAPSAPLFSTAPPPLPRSPPPPTPSPPRCTPPSRSPPPAMPPSPKVAAAASGSPALPQDCLAAVASAAAVKTEPRDEEDVAVVLKKEPRDEEDDAVVLKKEPRDEEDGAAEMKSVKREPSETCDSSEADKSQVESEATPGIGEECLAPTESVESEDKTDSGAIAQCDDDTSNASAVGAHEGPKSTSEGLYDPSRNVAVDRKSVSGEVDECAGGVSDRSETAVIEKCPSDAGLLAKCAEGSCSASSDSVGPDRTAPSGTDNRAGGLGYKCASIYRTDGRTLIELCGGKLGRRAAREGSAGVGEGGGQDGAARSQSANESGSIHESDSSGAAEETVSPAPDDGDPEDDEDDEDDVNKKLELVLRGLMDFVESSDDDSATNVAALTDAEDSDERVKGGAEAAVKQVNADDLDKRQDAAKCARADRVVLPTSVPATASAASKKRPTPLPCSAPISPMKATRVVQTRYCLVNAPRVDVGDAGSSPSNGTLKKPVASKAPGSAKQRSTGTPTPSSAAPAPPDAAALSRLTGESTGAARPNTMPWLKLATWRVGPLPHHMHTFGGSILLKHMRQHHIDVVALYGVAAAGWAGAKSKNFDGYRVVWSGPPGQPSSGFAVHSSALDKDSVMSLGSVTRLLLRAKTLKVRDTCVVCANAPEPQAEGLGEGPAQTQFYEDLCRVLEAVAPDAMLIVVGDFGKLDGAQFAELAKRFDLEHRAIWAATTTLGTMESMQADAHSKVARIENLFIRRSRGQWVRYFSTAMSVKAAKKAVPRSVHCTAVVQVDVLDVRRSSAAISAAIAWPTTQTSGKRKMSESEPVECAKRRAGPLC